MTSSSSRGGGRSSDANGSAAFERVFEFLSHGLIRVDSGLRVVSANEPARRHFHPAKLREGETLPEPWRDTLAEMIARAYDEEGEPERRPQLAEKIDGPKGVTIAVFPPLGGGLALIHTEQTTVVERRSRAESEFVANAAHELLTPLTGIVGAAHALESGAKAVPEIRDRFLRHIARECDRLARVARALLVLARAQSGQEPPRRELLSVGAALADAAADAQAADRVDVEAGGSVTAYADRDLVGLALTNIFANAVRHAGAGRVAATIASVDGDVIAIDIRDTGPGIAAGDVARMQERFVTGSGRDGAGFGLGIAIAVQAIESTGGRLAIASAEGGGTRVRIELPAAAPRGR